MTVTVQDIINLPIFKTAKVRTGIDLLDKRQVEWMSAIEGPVENFVRKREFILTTGMGSEHDPDQLFQFVKDVYESGASALAIAVGRYVFEIPQNIIDFAKEKEFVIIELPWELRFADIQRETMKLITKSQEEFSEQAHQTQKKLIDFVVQGKDLSHIIKYVERKLQCEIVYADSKGRMKYASADPHELLRLWNEIEISDVDEEYFTESNYRHIQQVPFHDGYLLKKEITTESRSLSIGHFIIYFPKKESLTDHAFQVLESLTATTALWISREDAIVKTEIRLRNEFIWGLAKAPQTIDDNMISKAKLFGYDLTAPYTCIIGYSTSFDALYDEPNHNMDYGFKNVIYYIEEEVKYAASVVDRLVAFTFDNDRLIIYLEHKDDEYNTVHHFLDLVDKRLNDIIPGVLFSWGIGKSKDGVMQFHESYKKALSALEMALKRKEPGARVSFEDTQLNRLLLHLANHEEVKHITLSTIAPLIDYEEEREIELIDTFIAYQNQNGNVSQAARVLNLHRQSLLYRLKKIESLTNLSLDNPDDVFLLNISIKVWQTGALKRETDDFTKELENE